MSTVYPELEKTRLCCHYHSVGWTIEWSLFYDLHVLVPLELHFYFLLLMEWDPVWLYVVWWWWRGLLSTWCKLLGRYYSPICFHPAVGTAKTVVEILVSASLNCSP